MPNTKPLLTLALVLVAGAGSPDCPGPVVYDRYRFTFGESLTALALPDSVREDALVLIRTDTAGARVCPGVASYRITDLKTGRGRLHEGYAPVYVRRAPADPLGLDVVLPRYAEEGPRADWAAAVARLVTRDVTTRPPVVPSARVEVGDTARLTAWCAGG